MPVAVQIVFTIVYTTSTSISLNVHGHQSKPTPVSLSLNYNGTIWRPEAVRLMNGYALLGFTAFVLFIDIAWLIRACFILCRWLPVLSSLISVTASSDRQMGCSIGCFVLSCSVMQQVLCAEVCQILQLSVVLFSTFVFASYCRRIQLNVQNYDFMADIEIAGLLETKFHCYIVFL